MPTDTSVNNLVINKLTKAQYETIQSPSETELYLVPDEVDTTPTSGSSNCVTSGGVYTALQSKADSSSIPTVPTNVSAFTNDAGYLTSHQDISSKADKVVVVDASTLPSTLDPNKVYQMGTLTGSVTIPAFSAVASGDTEAKIWCFTFETGTTAPTITWPAAITNWVGGSAPTINASKKYEVTVMDGIGAIMEA